MTARILTEEGWARWGWMAEAVAARHGVTVAELLSRCRESEIASARADLMSCLWGSGLAYAAIGRLLDRDSSTVLVAVRRDLRGLAKCRSRRRASADSQNAVKAAR